MYYQESYNRHTDWYNKHFPTRESKIDCYRKAKSAGNHHIAHWLQQLFFNCLDPLLRQQPQKWLTVGDAYGFDAQYILASGNDALATDLSTDFLEVAKDEGVISAYAAENAEKLSFADQQFDYVLCKESYHHFPRPYAALYEMIRVAKKGIVIIEPQDPVLKMPLLLFINNLLATNVHLLNKAWKNRFSFEPVGNFVYKVSEREFEKFAAGLNLPMVAFKKINPNFYFKGADELKTSHKKFLSIRVKKQILDVLVKLKLMPGQVLATIIFKERPGLGCIEALKKQGYHLVNIPVNPYSK
ncbi:class I SAM-dependent methyltransferase [Mucilaginibacter paludis]|uniref:Methyltransferase type 11 n=1 Tax=Mucilaginibacter paludis DSM 18603 TaxID=714943 RepID=H1YBE0_9SPHI|nr:class I SAM-dependent methyltransferase [Mucilaginibacter paludis]EHQ31194.1 Methyltransferase type 11 [Mucilaginibacter paludis DSM 18603]